MPLERTLELDAALLPATIAPGATRCVFASREPLVRALDDGTRLKVRGAGSLGVRALDDDELLELLDPELDDSPLDEPDDDPDEPEDPDDPEDVDPPRGTACPFATDGAARAAVTIKDNARRVDLSITRSWRLWGGLGIGSSVALIVQLYCQ